MMLLKAPFFKIYLLLLLVAIGFGCKQSALYERLQNIPESKWKQSDVRQFKFAVKDTQALYRVYVVVRHTARYAYRNIWLNAGIQYPGDSLRIQQFELPLASGSAWLGVGMDDVYERRILLLPRPIRFTRTGTILFTLQHTMRMDTLPQILQVGIRVEPVIKVE